MVVYDFILSYLLYDALAFHIRSTACFQTSMLREHDSTSKAPAGEATQN